MAVQLTSLHLAAALAAMFQQGRTHFRRRAIFQSFVIMSRTVKHPPKPDRFTKRHRTAAHQARSRRVLATLRFLSLEQTLPEYMLTHIKRNAGEQ